MAKTAAPRNIPKTNEVVIRTLDIINCLYDTYFVLKNAQTGQKTRLYTRYGFCRCRLL